MKNTTKAIDTVMFNLVTFREDMKDLPRETVCDHIENYRKLIKELPLKRDQYAANAMLNAMIVIIANDPVVPRSVVRVVGELTE